MTNYTILNIASIFKPDFTFTMSVQDIVAVLGALSIKMGQKFGEKKNNDE